MHAPRKAKTDAELVHEELLQHRGRARAITGARICRILKWEPNRERDVRRLIEEHANSDWPGVLCAVPGVGYFFAVNLEEINQYRLYLLCLTNAARAKVERFDIRVAAEGFSLEGFKS